MRRTQADILHDAAMSLTEQDRRIVQLEQVNAAMGNLNNSLRRAYASQTARIAELEATASRGLGGDGVERLRIVLERLRRVCAPEIVDEAIALLPVKP